LGPILVSIFYSRLGEWKRNCIYEMNGLHQKEKTANFQKGRITFLNYIAEFGRQPEKTIFTCIEEKESMH